MKSKEKKEKRKEGSRYATFIKDAKRLLFLLFSLFSFLSVFVQAAEVKLVAASYSDRYHRSSCKVVEKIAPEDLVTYATPEEAWAAGLKPCKKCNPPVPLEQKTSQQGTNFSPKGETEDF